MRTATNCLKEDALQCQLRFLQNKGRRDSEVARGGFQGLSAGILTLWGFGYGIEAAEQLETR